MADIGSEQGLRVVLPRTVLGHRPAAPVRDGRGPTLLWTSPLLARVVHVQPLEGSTVLQKDSPGPTAVCRDPSGHGPAHLHSHPSEPALPATSDPAVVGRALGRLSRDHLASFTHHL